jgi:quinol monooxygenase YgiN
MRYAQIFRYTLDMAPSDYTAKFVDPYAEAIAAVPGLIRKTWMSDFDTNEFASFYLWENKDAMDAFMASPAIATVAAEPFLKDLEITALPVAEEASAITRGL